MTQKTRLLVLYFSAFVYLGMAGAVFGPTLLSLVQQTDSSLKIVSLIFPIRSGSYLVGSWLTGILVDQIRGNRIVTGSLLVMGISLGIIPLLMDPISLGCTLLLLGLAMGFLDVSCNTLLLRFDFEKIGPAINALHFFYGFGAFLAPMILAAVLNLEGRIVWGFWGLALISLPLLFQTLFLQESTLKDTHLSNQNIYIIEN